MNNEQRRKDHDDDTTIGSGEMEQPVSIRFKSTKRSLL